MRVHRFFRVPLHINFIFCIVLCLDLYLLFTEYVSSEDVSFTSSMVALTKY